MGIETTEVLGPELSVAGVGVVPIARTSSFRAAGGGLAVAASRSRPHALAVTGPASEERLVPVRDVELRVLVVVALSVLTALVMRVLRDRPA